MVGKAKSANLKGIIRESEREANIQQALHAYWTTQRDDGPQRGQLSKIAKKFNASVSTLWRRINKTHRSRTEFLASRQKLSPKKEAALVDFILECSDRSLPLTHRDIRHYATYMVNGGKRAGALKVVLGKNWVPNFLDRHHTVLSTHWSSPLDSKRTSSLTPQAVENHFRCVKETTEKYDIIPENDYGMDESPIMLGFAGTKRVVGRAGAKRQHSRRDGSRESLTVVETICADGTVLKPTVIFQGKTFAKDWGGPANNPIKAQICRSEKGFTDVVLGLAYIKHFDAQTREKAAGRYRRLFVDNHNSHCTIELLRFARANRIVVVGYPPHCTHRLQGLDVICFARVKVLWGIERDRIEQEEGGKVAKRDFIRVYARVREKAFTEDTVKAAFRATGIHPFNPAVITPQMMAPSRAHSTETGAPLPLPSPLHAVRQALLQTIHPNPSTPSQSPPRSPLLTPAASSLPVSPPPSSPLTTPTRFRIASIINNLRKTSAAPLVSTNLAEFTSATPIPALHLSPLRPGPPLSFIYGFGSQPQTCDEPPAEHAMDIDGSSDMEEDIPEDAEELTPRKEALMTRVRYLEDKVQSYECQLLLQDLYCTKSQKKLYTQENAKSKPKTKREILQDKGKRDMTADEWIACDEEEEMEKTRITALVKEKAQWKAREKEEREEGDARKIADWEKVRDECRAAKIKPPLKPKKSKACPTPERFAELKKTKKKKAEVVEVLSEDESHDDGEIEAD